MFTQLEQSTELLKNYELGNVEEYENKKGLVLLKVLDHRNVHRYVQVNETQTDGVDKMQKSANGYAERYDVKFGIPNVKPKPGETFDRNNDLTLSECGAIVYHRDGHVTRGTIFSATSDAFIEYNRRHMTKAAFDEHYGECDEVSESMMLHGANG